MTYFVKSKMPGLLRGTLILLILTSGSSCKNDNTENKEDIDKITSWEAPDIQESLPVTDLRKEELSVEKDATKMAIFPGEAQDTVTSVDDDLVAAAERVGGNGDLKITLLWNFPGDIDVHVQQPSGKMINYQRKKDSSSGGFLDVDNIHGGRGSAENIFWRKPPKGTYKVWVKYYPMSQGTGSGTANLVLFRKGEQSQTFEVPMHRPGDEAFVTSFEIQ